MIDLEQQVNEWKDLRTLFQKIYIFTNLKTPQIEEQFKEKKLEYFVRYDMEFNYFENPRSKTWGKH